MEVCQVSDAEVAGVSIPMSPGGMGVREVLLVSEVSLMAVPYGRIHGEIQAIRSGLYPQGRVRRGNALLQMV